MVETALAMAAAAVPPGDVKAAEDTLQERRRVAARAGVIAEVAPEAEEGGEGEEGRFTFARARAGQCIAGVDYEVKDEAEMEWIGGWAVWAVQRAAEEEREMVRGARGEHTALAGVAAAVGRLGRGGGRGRAAEGGVHDGVAYECFV